MAVFSDQVALITGASAGIGAELARAMRRRGADLVLVARREDRLRALADELRSDGGRAVVHVVVADLAAEGACERALADAVAKAGRVDALLNNAGIGEYGAVSDQEPDALSRMMRLNMEALVRLTRAALPAMIERRRGWVMNVASMAAFQPFPYMNVYSASKSFVVRFTLALREELRKSGVIVTCVCPGTTRTEFFDRGSFEQRRDEFRKLAQEPAFVAEGAVAALARGKAMFVPGAMNRFSAVVQRMVPDRWLARLLGKYMKPRR